METEIETKEIFNTKCLKATRIIPVALNDAHYIMAFNDFNFGIDQSMLVRFTEHFFCTIYPKILSDIIYKNINKHLNV